MKENELRKFSTISKHGVRKFRKLAEASVDFDCRNFDGSRLIGAQRANAVEVLMNDYSVGSNFTRSRYLQIGFMTGVVTVIGILTITKVLKRDMVGK